ncbi:hypothetical protein FSST1_009305 [Fusarium sambucinum]
MSDIETISSFVDGAPPGELADVIADIKSLTLDSNPDIVNNLAPAFEKYNEEQFVTVKLPGSSQPVGDQQSRMDMRNRKANMEGQVIISPYNSLGDGRYFDIETSSSFAFDHTTQKASAVQSHVLEGTQVDLVKSILKSIGPYVEEHFANAAHGVYPIESDSKIAIVIVGNKYSPNNFWNGRWRSLYILDPSSGALEGSLKVDVHYYEDGNVRLLTNKTVSSNISSVNGAGIVREISTTEKKYQEELNKGFVSLSEGAFKGLRRQLPVTRQKIEWDRVTSYRLGQDIGGGSSRR